MHVIKGMVGCLGDMKMMMTKLHDEQNLAYCNKQNRVVCGDIWP